MEIHDTVQHTAALVLQLDPAANGAQVVAQLGRSRGLDARKDSLDWHSHLSLVVPGHARGPDMA